MNKPQKAELLQRTFILLWVIVVNVAAPFITSMQVWPMWFVSIMFFLHGANLKEMPMLLSSSVMGLLIPAGGILLMGPLGNAIGAQAASYVVLVVMLAIIFIGGAFVPFLFNNVTFAYLTIATINMEILLPNLLGWVILALAGGAVLVGGQYLMILLSTTLSSKHQTDQESAASSS